MGLFAFGSRLTRQFLSIPRSVPGRRGGGRLIVFSGLRRIAADEDGTSSSAGDEAVEALASGEDGLPQPGRDVDLGGQRPVDGALVRDLEQPRALLVGERAEDLDNPLDAVDLPFLGLAVRAVEG